MNKSMAMVAVVLSVITAFYLVNISGGSDGSAPSGFSTVSDADTVSYTDDTLPGTMIYITSASIKAEAFKGCTTLNSVQLSENVKTIGANAFEGCTALYSFTTSKTTSIGDGCFKNTGKTAFYFTSDLTSVGTYAFEGCQGTGPYLFGTGVTSIKNGTFKDSKVAIEDLRGVTDIATDAFSGCNMHGQIIETGQTAKLSDIPEIEIADGNITGLSVAKNKNVDGYNLTFFVKNKYSNLRFTESGSTEDVTPSSNIGGYSCIYTFMQNNLRVEGLKWTIHFPEVTGMDDVTHIAGDGDYTIPKPSVASNLFTSWNLKGDSATVTKITETDFRDSDADIYLEAAYNTITVTYDHTGISDASGLPTSGVFSVGDAYPSLQDVSGYSFTKWKVGDNYYLPGSKIVTYRNHTAQSVWSANTATVSVVSLGSVVSTKTLDVGSALELSNLTVTVPESKRFMGWSLTENGTVLTSDPRISGDCRIYAVFEDKAQYTVRHLDGSTVLASATVYDGSVYRIELDNPTTEGKTFQNWVLGDSSTKYFKGETVAISGNTDLVAVWKNDTVTIEYYLSTCKIVKADYGTEMTIGCDGAMKEGYTLQGWSTTSKGEVEYHDGDKLVLKKNLYLYPVWKENGQSTATDPQQSTSDTSKTTVPSEDTKITTSATTPTTTTNPQQPSSSTSATDPKTTATTTTTVTPTQYCLRIMDGSITLDESLVEYGDKKRLSEVVVPDKEGYRFLGWSKVEGSDRISLTTASMITITGDITLYSVWVKLIGVTYHDGTTTDTVYCENKERLTLKTLEKTGSEFLGWKDESSGTVYTGTISVSKDLDLYPQWKTNDSMPAVTDPVTTPAVTTTTVKLPEDAKTVVSETDEGGDSNIGLLAIGAAIAAIVSIVVVLQIRRA